MEIGGFLSLSKSPRYLLKTNVEKQAQARDAFQSQIWKK